MSFQYLLLTLWILLVPTPNSYAGEEELSCHAETTAGPEQPLSQVQQRALAFMEKRKELRKKHSLTIDAIVGFKSPALREMEQQLLHLPNPIRGQVYAITLLEEYHFLRALTKDRDLDPETLHIGTAIICMRAVSAINGFLNVAESRQRWGLTQAKRIDSLRVMLKQILVPNEAEFNQKFLSGILAKAGPLPAGEEKRNLQLQRFKHDLEQAMAGL